MSFYVIRCKSVFDNSIDSPVFSVGRGTGAVHGVEGTALVFSSQQSGKTFIRKHKLRGCKLASFDMILGQLLERFASLDLCTDALIDGTERVVFLSCGTGHYILPAHFYRYHGGTYQGLSMDNLWYDQEIEPDYPTCGCGTSLAPSRPAPAEFKNASAIPGLHQVIAGSHTSFDGTMCRSIVMIDIRPPQNETLLLEVATSADRKRESFLCYVTPSGLSAAESPETDEDPWIVCSVSGMVRIPLTHLTNYDGLDWVELHLCQNASGRKRRVASTGKARNLPVVQYESFPGGALSVLDSLRDQSVESG